MILQIYIYLQIEFKFIFIKVISLSILKKIIISPRECINIIVNIYICIINT